MNDIVARPAECQALLDAVANAVCMANHFRCKIPHVKAFCVLTDEQNDVLFPCRARARVRKHVPWTRVVAVPHRASASRWVAGVLAERAGKPVFQASDEYGGSGVKRLGIERSGMGRGN